MFRRTRKVRKYPRRGQNLISKKKLQPITWKISHEDVKAALKRKGIEVKAVRKMTYLKHQVCISYWDAKNNPCSSFFSYRIFEMWATEVAKLITYCPTLREWQELNRLMRYEFKYYDYLPATENALRMALENRLYVLQATKPLAVF